MLLSSLYPYVKPLIPKPGILFLRRLYVDRLRRRHPVAWPIDERAGNPPPGFKGWPDGKRFALVLTHDVERMRGQEKCSLLAEHEMHLGFRSSFNFVAEGYRVNHELRRFLVERGFEVGVHGLTHTGNPFRSKALFDKQAPKINHYLNDWEAVGFRAPSMYHDLDMVRALDIEYDASTFDTDPFEPQPDGVGTIFPFWVSSTNGKGGYVELPYTLPQDFTLFVIMGEDGPAIWKKKLDWIAARGGMALLIAHPDYMYFNGGRRRLDEYPAAYFEQFLAYVRDRYEGQYWQALPREVARFWREQVVPAAAAARPPLIEVGREPIRACMLSYSFYESDNRVMRYAEALARRGDQVDVIALRKEGLPEFEVLRGVNVYRIQPRAIDERGKLSYLTRILRFLLKSGAMVTRKHGRMPYQLIHVHSVPDFEIFAAAIPKLRGARLILDIHDIVPEFYASKFGTGNSSSAFKALIMAEKFSTSFADHVIISNHLWYETLVARSVPREKCTVVLNYPDSHLFSPTPRTRQDDRFIVLYPGTLNRHQGLDLAVRAIARIKDTAPNVELHIYGKGSEKDALLRLVDELGVRDCVRIHDLVPIDRIGAIMADADLGVVPKRNDPFGGEAFSTKILEFMTLRVPVVVARTKVDSYYFNDSVVKFFTPDDDIDLGDAMLAMIKDKAERERLVASASTFVEDFSWDKKQQEYFDIVDRLVASRD